MDRCLKPLCLAGLLGFAPLTWAQHVYKCVGDLGTSYQSSPCMEGQRLARRWDAAHTPGPAPDPQQSAERQVLQEQPKRGSSELRSRAKQGSRVQRRSRPTGVNISAARDGVRCANAKERRDDTERKLGLDRTYQTMQRLTTLVSEACR